MGALASRGWRFAAAVGLAFATAVVAPMACIFPSYTFEPSANGGSGAMPSGSTMSGSVASTGSMASTSSTGGGGSTTTASSSSSGGPPCASQNCSDPTCAQSFACVPATPPAGTQYFALYDGIASTFTGCDSAFPQVGYTGNNMISFEPATCNCTCGTPTGQTCGVTGSPDPNTSGTIDPLMVVDEACGTTQNCAYTFEVPATWDGACYGMDDAPGAGSPSGKQCGPQSPTATTCNTGDQPCDVAVTITQLAVANGSCTANGQPPTIPPVTWGTLGEACGGAIPGTGCPGASDSCMPIPQAPFHSGLCIMQTPGVMCSGQFSETHAFYGSSMDTRDCSACSCGAPAGGSCSAKVDLYGGLNCTGTAVATLMPTSEAGDCASLGTTNPAVGSRSATFTAVTGGTCTSEAQPTGTATPTNPTTFCCIP